uniref:Uncharacterized protein n=1 Tax=Alexandrium monilatum TaxID=311494 RepID=A0A7S4SX98_9DINO|mmetsp:Transcript_60732/g.190408  ORF Transcript_60732/g.190408 Transcript_60732/m.190408 type:complete len:472 (+) Transcript_60732:62-1477(+)
MCDIDWSKLYEATSREDKATPGYVFNEIVQNMSYADPRHFPAVAEYLTDCVDGDHAHVKLKALFVIKTVAYRVPPFCNCMRERITSVQEACSFQGPPSAIYGDEPYRLIREAAEAAMEALTGGEHYHEQYRALSQRIVGFGNFQPDEDTVLPDGSVNVGRDVTVKDVALSAVGFVQTRVGALLGGVKDVFYSPFNQKKAGVGALGADEGEEGDEAADGVGGYDDDNDEPRDEEPRGETDEDGFYRPSCGSYVPPALPNPAPAAEETPQGEREELESIRDLFEEDETGYWPEECALPGRAEPSAAAGPQDEASFMDMLGLGGGGPGPGTGAGPLALGEEALEPSEAEILDILGLSGGCMSGLGNAPVSHPGEATIAAGNVGADHCLGLRDSRVTGLGEALATQPGGATAAAGVVGEDGQALGPGAMPAVAAPVPTAAPAATCSEETPERPPLSAGLPQAQSAAFLGPGLFEV